MELEANKALCDRIATAVSACDLDALETLLTPEVATNLRARLIELFAAFPDFHGANLEQIAEGDRVVSRWVFLGTHMGEYKGVPASGKTTTFSGVSIARIVGGKVAALYCLADEQAVMRQVASEVPEEMLESLHTSIWFALRGVGKNFN